MVIGGAFAGGRDCGARRAYARAQPPREDSEGGDVRHAARRERRVCALLRLQGAFVGRPPTCLSAESLTAITAFSLSACPLSPHHNITAPPAHYLCPRRLVDNTPSGDKVPDFQRVNNDDDLIPIVPGRFLGYLHPHGEVHMLRTGYAVACDGNDNDADELCQIKSVPTVFQGNIVNHLGPYEGIWIGTTFCT